MDARPIRDGAVAVDGDRIAWVGRAALAPSGEVTDLGAALLLPALVNVHTHLDLTGFRGLLEGLDFVTWIRTLTAAKREVLRDDDLHQAALAGIAEGLLAGVGTFGDTSDRAAAFRAMCDTGVRGVAYQEVFGPDPAHAAAHVAELATRADALARDATSLVRVGVSPHAPYSVSDALYRATAVLATERGWPLATHIAESADEQELVTEGRGAFADFLRGRDIAVAPRASSPMHLLHETGVLATRPLLIHAVRCRRDALDLVQASGAAVAHCPCSNAKLGHGVAPLREWLDRQIPVGLGSDSMASNNRMDLLEEARVAGLLQSARAGRPDAVSAPELLHLATLGGAQALGLMHEIGSLEPGKAADVAAFPLGALAGAADLDPAAAAVFALGGTRASHVMVAGRVLVADGRLVQARHQSDAAASALADQARRLAEWRDARSVR
jgi:cytosine/adenosine deaminase-related metal-dependent hydrolase